jgi:hypothetical protein
MSLLNEPISLQALGGLFFLTFLSHGLLLLNKGIYWDSWILRKWVEKKEWRTMKVFYREVGMPFFYYVHRAFNLSPNSIWLYRLACFLSLWSTSALVFLICHNFSPLDEWQSFFIAAMMLMIPIQDMALEFCVTVQYVLTQTLFYCAILLCFSLTNLDWGLDYLLLRSLMIILFLMSFNMNSLLVFYGAFVFYFFVYQYLSLNQNIPSLALSNLDLFSLPFVFWFLKNKHSPKSGHHKNYNKISLKFSQIRASYKSLVVDLFLPFLKKIYASSIPALSLLALLHFSGLMSIGLENDSQPQSMPALTLTFLIGSLLLLAATLPYSLTRQVFGYTGWETKNNLLLPLPLSIIAWSLIACFLQSQALSLYFQSFLLLIFLLLCVDKHLLLISIWGKQEALLEIYAKEPAIKNSSIIGIHDEHPIQYGHLHTHPEYHSNAMAFLFSRLFGKLNKIGYQRFSSNLTELPKHTIEELKSGLAQNLIGFDESGGQCIIRLSSPERIPSFRKLAIFFLLKRLESHKKATAFVKSYIDYQVFVITPKCQQT